MRVLIALLAPGIWTVPQGPECTVTEYILGLRSHAHARSSDSHPVLLVSQGPAMSIHESVTSEQPEKIPSPSPSLPEPAHAPRNWDIRGRVKRAHKKVTTKHGWVGDYDYAWLCMPTFPWGRKAKKSKLAPPFYALDSELPLILAAASGLQHALAMLAGLITPPIIFASALNLDSATSAYMISASLIGCGE